MKRIGLLYPSSGVSEAEYLEILPKGVSLHVTRIPLAVPTYEAVLHTVDQVEEASRLLADARVDIIAFGCTAGSLIGGKGFDHEIIRRIEQATGIKATTAITAVLAGLKALNLRKFILLTPYTKQVHEAERHFLEGEGFEILNDRCLELSNCIEQYGTEPSRWYELAKQLDRNESQGCFISCGGIRVVGIIELLEKELGKPVITTNQALTWHCLRKIGVQEAIGGFGRLMTLPLRN